MKEINNHQKDEIRHEIPDQHQKKPQFLSRKPLKKNQTLFEFNFREDTITKVQYENQDLVHINGTKPKKKVFLKENCLYIPALNFKNAIRHIHNKISKEYNPKIIK